MNMTIEEIDLGCEELEAISNSKWQAIPIVYFQKDGKSMHFNRPAEKLVNFERFTISFNSTYIVFTPSDGKSGYTYRITQRGSTGTASASSTNLTNRIPSVKGKHFKLYKSGNRFCIKRNEPMEG